MVLMLLAACGQNDDQEQTSPVSEEVAQEAPVTAVETIAATRTQQPAPAATSTQTETQSQPEPVPTEVAEEPTSTRIPAEATATEAPVEANPEPIDVTYFTPAQAEGPYYTISKPDDRDNDLTRLEGASGQPEGEVIEFGGRVYDANGMPFSGVVVEIWQTDASGVYLHPGDPGTDQRDRNFQFYGESITANDGSYHFRTILPGHYEPRPRHIHVKFKLEGKELLTTQFYFEGDSELADESMFNQTQGDGIHLIITLIEGQDSSGEPVLLGERDVILNVELSS
jgi:protocatechuate 3,4-dioxygenase beta subunit